MPGRLDGYETEPTRDLVSTLRVLEEQIDKLVADPALVQWDVTPGSALMQETRFLAFSTVLGRVPLMIARARGPGREPHREVQYGIRTSVERLQWLGGVTINPEDVTYAALTGARGQGAGSAANRLLARLEYADPLDHMARPVRNYGGNICGALVDMYWPTRRPTESRQGAVLLRKFIA